MEALNFTTPLPEDSTNPLYHTDPTKCGTLRVMRAEGQSFSAAHLNALNALGIDVLPCIGTEFSNDSAFTTYLTDWLNALNFTPPWVEVGNEYQGPIGDYIDRLKLAAPILRNRQIRIVGMACIDLTTYGAFTGTSVLARALNDGFHTSSWDLVDSLAIHAYSHDPSGSDPQTTTLRGFMPGGKRVSMTEFGWPSPVTAMNFTNAGAFTCTNAQQASNLTSALDALLAKMRAQRYAHLIQFVHSDYILPSSSWDHHCGLTDENGVHKPSWDALKNYQLSGFSVGQKRFRYY